MNDKEYNYTYILTYFDNGRKVGELISVDLAAVERERTHWAQESATHTSALETQLRQAAERVGETTDDTYLVQGNAV